MIIPDTKRVVSFTTAYPTQMTEAFRVRRADAVKYLRQKLTDEGIHIELMTSDEQYFLVVTFGSLESALSFYGYLNKLLELTGWRRFLMNAAFLKAGQKIPDNLTRINPE